MGRSDGCEGYLDYGYNNSESLGLTQSNLMDLSKLVGKILI